MTLGPDHSIGNMALAAIAVLALAAAAALAVARLPTNNMPDRPAVVAVTPLACLDGLAGAAVESACERALFATPEAAASAVAYTAAQIDRLTSMQDTRTPEAIHLARVLSQDRHGLVAHVLTSRNGCSPAACDAFRLFKDPGGIVAQMKAQSYAALIARHAPRWEEGAVTIAPSPASDASSPPAGKPSSIEFPNSDSIPSVSIMAPEPALPPHSGSVRPPQPTTSSPAAKSRPVRTPTEPTRGTARPQNLVPSGVSGMAGDN